MKSVLHVPLGIAATSVSMATSVVIAVSSPHPTPKPDGWTGITPDVVDSVIPPTTEIPSVASLSPAREELPQGVEPLLPDEVKSIETPVTAKAYLAETADGYGTIVMLGRAKSVECFHPQFAMNLAAAIRDARKQGFPNAGVLSGCRPPKLGIGGFADKKNSLHGVGLAADITGIGAPCSTQARRFHEIAATHGVLGVYGPCNRAEWNHMQGTAIKMTTPALRASFTPDGGIAPDLERLWAIEEAVVVDTAASASVLLASLPVSATPRRSAKRAHASHRHASHSRAKRHSHIASRARHHQYSKRQKT